MPTWLSAILTNGAVWSAFILLINTLLFYLDPQFPREVWASINGFVIAILAALGINGVKARLRAHTYARTLAEQLTSRPHAREPSLRDSGQSASEETLGPNAASIHVGGTIKDSNVGAGGRDVRQG